MDIGKFFGGMFGSAAAGAATPAATIVEGAQKIIGMFKLSPDVKAQIDAELTAEKIDLEKAELAANVASIQGQLDVNKAEAQSTNIFIAGWRPAVGWISPWQSRSSRLFPAPLGPRMMVRGPAASSISISAIRISPPAA